MSNMSYTEARELCLLRLKEDNITAAEAAKEFRQLTNCRPADTLPFFRLFEKHENRGTK